MKVFLVRDNSELTSRYIVYSQSGDTLCEVNAKYSTGSQKMNIYSDSHRIAKIRDVSIGKIKTYYISTENDKFSIVMSDARSKFAVIYHGIGFHLRGNVLEKSYDIMDIDNSLVACVQKRFNTSKETLELNINNDKYLVHCIASAVCLNSLCTTDALALQAT